MLKTEAELATLPTGGEGLAEQRAEWDRRRRTWASIRVHEGLARTHVELANEHEAAAERLLEEVHST